ncbi:MAG: exodeoxyribonuclease VII large subunit, partial [Clostridia bacterium]|nr:exodeoxyribonuclease VII large subunit [Clostridia bacterium]
RGGGGHADGYAGTVVEAPADGEVVLVRGHVGVYERGGQYQLYVEELWRDARFGVGSRYAALEALKARLQREGLFDPARKRPLPRLPRRVAVVTSPAGAALRDILRVARRRDPDADLLVVPTPVQGAEAPAAIAAAIAAANRVPDVDVIIVGRGGGSVEELWAFNSEAVVRAIAASTRPVVSAVGHETDWTLADLAADVRAPTPSAAAEAVVPERAALRRDLGLLARRLKLAGARALALRRERLERLAGRRVLERPDDLLAQPRQRLDELSFRLASAARGRVQAARVRWERANAQLRALDPRAVLGRGYSLCLGPGGRVLRRADEVAVGEAVRVVLQRGALDCTVEARGLEASVEEAVVADGGDAL